VLLAASIGYWLIHRLDEKAHSESLGGG